MKVRYKGTDIESTFTYGKVYEVDSWDDDFQAYDIVDDDGDCIVTDPDEWDIVEGDVSELEHYAGERVE